MNIEQQAASNRDYNTISPSAKALLLLKGLTDIPYARQAAELISQPEEYVPDFTKKDFMLWVRALHFDNRYRSINQLLQEVPVKNILELSSGFSFRGLAAVQDADVTYIDTDLPELMATKQQLVAELSKGSTPKGKLELLPLNAVDERQFVAIADRFPVGSIGIINEGLLMYLGVDEKKKLCRIILDILHKR